MRWGGQMPGDQRECQRFLLLPKRIGRQVRWLEVARWVEKYNYWPGGRWEAIRWLDRETQR